MTSAKDKSPAKGDRTRDKIKKAARELFSKYGIDAVTTRDIATAAAQKNGAAINYYFRSKDDLILEILDDAFRAVDTHRTKLVDDLENSGREITIRDIIRILVSRHSPEEQDQTRLFTMLQLYRRDLMHTAIPGRWDKAYKRCVAHLRRLLPDYPEPVLSQRLYFLTPYLWTFMATREGGEERGAFWTEFWADPSALESLLDTAEGILVVPPSSDTLRALAQARSAAG